MNPGGATRSSHKVSISEAATNSIVVMRTGLEQQDVVGLHQTGIPDEVEPSLNVRFMGTSEKAIMSYLVSAYYPATILSPDALGVLENVEENVKENIEENVEVGR